MVEDLTEDAIVELGNYCAGLRESSYFNLLLKQFELQIVNQMMNTEPHEQKKREGIYASCLGVRDFQTHMNAFVDARDKIIEANKTKTEPSEYDAQPAEEDID